MNSEKVGPEAFFPVLKALNETGATYFLEGGQAVNIWARHVQSHVEDCSALLRYDPFTSKDCDIYVDLEAVRFFEQAGGQLHKSQSPADGQFAIYVLPENDTLHIDLMTSVYGIPLAQIPRVVRRAQKVNGLYILDPIYLLKAKCHNLADLPQAGRQDSKHVGMLSFIVPAYFLILGRELASENLTDRQVIKELKFLIENCTKDQTVERILEQQGVSLNNLIPIESLISAGGKTLQKFLHSELGGSNH